MAVILAPLGWASFILLGKAWAIGYALTILCVVLGIAAVGVPSRRKRPRG